MFQAQQKVPLLLIFEAVKHNYFKKKYIYIFSIVADHCDHVVILLDEASGTKNQYSSISISKLKFYFTIVRGFRCTERPSNLAVLA